MGGFFCLGESGKNNNKKMEISTVVDQRGLWESSKSYDFQHRRGGKGGVRMEAVRDAIRERNTNKLSFFFKTVLIGAGISYT